MRKPTFCIICENKDEDQLCGNRKVNQRLCFDYIDSAIPERWFSHEAAQVGIRFVICGQFL